MGLNLGYLTALLGGSPVVPGTGAASQPVVLDSSRNIANINSLTAAALVGPTAGAHTGTLRFTVNADVAGAGTIQSDAAQLLEGFTVITGANGTLGWKLPVGVAGMVCIIKGTTAGVAKLWPSSGSQINAVGADTAMSFASGVIPAILIAKSATQWYTLPLLPS